MLLNTITENQSTRYNFNVNIFYLNNHIIFHELIFFFFCVLFLIRILYSLSINVVLDFIALALINSHYINHHLITAPATCTIPRVCLIENSIQPSIYIIPVVGNPNLHSRTLTHTRAPITQYVYTDTIYLDSLLFFIIKYILI